MASTLISSQVSPGKCPRMLLPGLFPEDQGSALPFLSPGSQGHWQLHFGVHGKCRDGGLYHDSNQHHHDSIGHSVQHGSG